ncbi:MAG: hypothetical protein JWM95_1216 [Gemmatimonadetes bacterium]|nr:hypothetical protein [Gemmatimonadota bacterium]
MACRPAQMPECRSRLHRPLDDKTQTLPSISAWAFDLTSVCVWLALSAFGVRTSAVGVAPTVAGLASRERRCLSSDREVILCATEFTPSHFRVTGRQFRLPMSNSPPTTSSRRATGPDTHATLTAHCLPPRLPGLTSYATRRTARPHQRPTSISGATRHFQRLTTPLPALTCRHDRFPSSASAATIRPNVPTTPLPHETCIS